MKIQMNIKENRKKRIVEILEEKGATKKPCLRCGENKLTLAGEYIFTLQNDPNTFVIGGRGIAVTMVVCTNCGYIWQHALGALGMEL